MGSASEEAIRRMRYQRRALQEVTVVDQDRRPALGAYPAHHGRNPSKSGHVAPVVTVRAVVTVVPVENAAVQIRRAEHGHGVRPRHTLTRIGPSRHSRSPGRPWPTAAEPLTDRPRPYAGRSRWTTACTARR